jgi:outer membrane cobalamin receptor
MRRYESNRSVLIIGPQEGLGTNKSVADAIAEHTGIQTRKYGGMGSFQTISIRGVKGSEILVLLDGVPLNSAMGGAVDLGAINPILCRI